MRSKPEYIEQCITKAEQYVLDVLDGKIITNKYIRLACERHMRDLADGTYHINRDALDQFFGFCFYIRIDGNRGAYVPFIPEPWQCFYFYSIYGWYHTAIPERRRFNTSFLTIARKNGKTVVAVIQCLFHLMKDGIDQKTYVVSESLAMAEDSALTYAKKIVENSPALSKRVERKQYSLRYKKGKSTSYFKMLPNKPEALNAIKPTFGIIDELHLMPTSEILDKMKSGMAATFNPLVCIVGTRGNNSTYFQYELEQTYIRILNGEIHDESVFIMMFCLDAEEEANLPEMWIKANPNIGSALFIENIQTDFETAKLTPVRLKIFFIDHFNLWVDGSDEDFIEEEFLRIAFTKGNRLTLKDFEGKKVYLGLDTSRTNDLSSLSLIHYDDDIGELLVYPFIYFPDNPTKKHRSAGIDLHNWIREGYIHEHFKKRIDYDLIVEDIIKISEMCEIISLGYDTYNPTEIVPKVESLGIECINIGQTIGKISPVTKLMDRFFAEERMICHNPAFKWQLKNPVVRYDADNNIKLDKNKSKDAIDTVYATLNAMELFRRDYGESLYNYSDQEFII